MTLQAEGTLGRPGRRFATRPSGGATELVCLACEATAPDTAAFVGHTCRTPGSELEDGAAPAETSSAPRPRRARTAESPAEE
ncbi:MAG TPA: hypothetical protein VF615_25565 [Longimicrobiaceae bacterium]|jgi:hypothetical protein